MGRLLYTLSAQRLARDIRRAPLPRHIGIILDGNRRHGRRIGVSDYPHPDSVWPNSRAAIERQMSHLPPEMRKKLTHDNAAALFGL